MRKTIRAALVNRLSEFDSVVEVGVGNRPAVAAQLVEAGVSVTATDLRDRPVPEGVTFVCDDVTDPDRAVYDGAEAIYARNLPPELHRPVADLARQVGARCLFTTLGGDQPAVPVDRETLAGTTLFLTESEPV